MENLKVWDTKGEVEINNNVAYDIKKSSELGHSTLMDE